MSKFTCYQIIIFGCTYVLSKINLNFINFQLFGTCLLLYFFEILFSLPLLCWLNHSKSRLNAAGQALWSEHRNSRQTAIYLLLLMLLNVIATLQAYLQLSIHVTAVCLFYEKLQLIRRLHVARIITFIATLELKKKFLQRFCSQLHDRHVDSFAFFLIYLNNLKTYVSLLRYICVGFMCIL